MQHDTHALPLDKKVIVISGAGAGLGLAVAHAALRDGAQVMLAARNADRLRSIAEELEQQYPQQVDVCATDVTDCQACAQLMLATIKRFGAVHAVANVAALDTVFGDLANSTEADWLDCFNTNVLGSMNICQAAVPHLKEAGGGALVLTGTQAMLKAPEHPQIAYAASKGALLAAMNHLVKELGPSKIRVNMVIPTWMWGPAVEGYINMSAEQQGRQADELLAEITANMPLGEMPSTSDVAEAINFFCSDRARMITGETLKVTAGEFM